MSFSFGDGDVGVGGGTSELTDAISTVAEQYETSLDSLLSAANGGSMNLAQTTVLTTQVQQQQAILEMVQGVVKAATQQIKDLGKRLG